MESTRESMIRLLGALDAPTSHIEKHSLIPPDAHNECAVKASLMIMIRKNKFFGLPTEDSLEHLELFEQLCSISKVFGVTEDRDMLRLFPHSLGDKATIWHRNLRYGPFTSWDACKQAFLTKFPSSTRNKDSEEMQRKEVPIMDTYIHSMPKTIFELHQQELAKLSTDYQGAYEPYTPGEYQPDWNYAPGNQYGNCERLHSSNMEFAYRSNSVAIPQDQFYAIQQQQPQHQSFNPYHQQQSLFSHQHHYKGYQQVQETHPPTGFVTQQPQMTNEPDFEIRDMLQQIIRDQENSVLENKKLLAEIKNTLETQGNKIRSMDITKHSEWTDDKEAECIPPQETVMEKALPNDTHLPFKKRYAAFTEDSDIQDGRGQNQTLQEFQAEKYAPETTLEQLTRSSDRVKSQISEKVHLTHSLDLLTESCSLLSNHQSFLNPNILLSDPDDEAKKKAVQAIWKTLLIELEALLEVEDVVQECYLPFECIVDENPVLRHEAKVEPLTTVSYSTKSNGERVCMGGKAFEDPCEGFIVVECILDKHLGVTSTNDLSTDEPKKVLFEKIRMKEFRGWFYDEYDPGDTWFYL